MRYYTLSFDAENLTEFTGNNAINIAHRTGAPISKYSDPTEPACLGLTEAQAIAVCNEDPSLIYVRVPAKVYGTTRGVVDYLREIVRNWVDAEDLYPVAMALYDIFDRDGVLIYEGHRTFVLELDGIALKRDFIPEAISLNQDRR